MTNLLELPAHVVIGKIKGNDLKAVEYVSVLIQRIKDIDYKINSFISTNFENAIKQAKIVDKKIQSGESVGMLAGIPIGIKDNISVKGLRNTCASQMLRDYESPYNATVVTNIEFQDGIVMGKTNMDEFGMGNTSEYSSFGPVKNPWNSEYVAGGSSGGSAAAVSSLQVPLALGSDTGGSIRCPSSFCSVVGLKPSYGRVSRSGLISYSNSLEQIGPVARNITDLALLFNTIEGTDAFDNTTACSHKKSVINSLDQITSKGYQIGIFSNLTENSDIQVQSKLMEMIKVFERHQFVLENIDLRLKEFAVAAYYIIATAEASSNLSRFDNVRYGYPSNPEGFEWNRYYEKSRSLFGDEVKRRILLGSFVLSAGYFGKYYAKAQTFRNMLRAEFERLFKKYDVLILPTMPILPIKLGEKISNPVQLYNFDLFTILANLTGLPAITLPAGFSDTGLPIGIQIMANSFEEQKLFDLAVLFEDESKFAERTPTI
ncbi:MAG: Asp-tRNA(Asn)/Glu-tRNA(Gln) amidotransferase subunit GatA [Candidatus Nitrosocosmicus sp.]